MDALPDLDLEYGLFPECEPFNRGMLPVDDLHTLYWEECGNPEGVPVLFIHGGPGGGCSPTHRRFFDPERYRIILFDQRGSGRSTPTGELKNNTTPLLVEDMEKLRTLLHIDRWQLFGGSWGVTLALAYAIAHPERVIAMILRGVFLCRPSEIHWFYQEAGMIMPEAFRQFEAFIPKEERHDLVRAYHKRLTCGDPAIEMEAAKMWSGYEGVCSTLLPNDAIHSSFLVDRTALCIARIETHYFLNDAFLPPEGLLGHIDKIRHIPTIIIQGRYDLVCPIVSADALARTFPEATYVIVPNGGHSAMDPPIQNALIWATDRMKSIVN